MEKVGAAYCVYEDTGTLNESIRRIYDLVDKVVVLLNYEPWNGVPDIEASFETYKKVRDVYDPNNKVVMISQHWKSEAEQRNFGKDYLHQQGIKWCFVIDDDEFYNRDQLTNMITVLQNGEMFVYLVKQQIYWKTRGYCISEVLLGMPVFVLSDNSKVVFTENRNVVVYGGNWETMDENFILCHHYSYVRTDAQMVRKFKTFSHAGDFSWREWFENIWLKWTTDSINLHPNPGSVSCFPKAIPVSEAKYKLEDINFNMDLERFLASQK